MRSAVLVENLRRQVHLRGQEFAALNAEVASLKAQVMELQRSLHHANQHIATLQKDNEDYKELVQVLQAWANGDNKQYVSGGSKCKNETCDFKIYVCIIKFMFVITCYEMKKHLGQGSECAFIRQPTSQTWR